MADEFEEALIFVGRLIERLNSDEKYRINIFMLLNISCRMTETI